MMPDASFIPVNHTSLATGHLDPENFRLWASPKTDIYSSPLPPTLHVYSAPIVHQQVKKSAFKLARVSFSFHASFQFDQGGLVFTIPSTQNPSPNAENATDAQSHPAWVKAGIETNDGKAWVSIVGKARNGWCDWSLVPLPGNSTLPAQVSATIEMTRYKNALMIWLLDEGGERSLIRKVPWVFLDDEDSCEDAWVGAYAARPDPDTEANGKELEIEFRGLCIETDN